MLAWASPRQSTAVFLTKLPSYARASCGEIKQHGNAVRRFSNGPIGCSTIVPIRRRYPERVIYVCPRQSAPARAEIAAVQWSSTATNQDANSVYDNSLR